MTLTRMRTAPDRAGAPPLILVVEDDPDVRRMVTTILALEGMSVIEAANGLQALELLRTTTVALVLMDNRLPGMDGRDVVRTMRTLEATSAVPVILVTADGDAADRVAGLDAGAID